MSSLICDHPQQRNTSSKRAYDQIIQNEEGVDATNDDIVQLSVNNKRPCPSAIQDGAISPFWNVGELLAEVSSYFNHPNDYHQFGMLLPPNSRAIWLNNIRHVMINIPHLVKDNTFAISNEVDEWRALGETSQHVYGRFAWSDYLPNDYKSHMAYKLTCCFTSYWTSRWLTKMPQLTYLTIGNVVTHSDDIIPLIMPALTKQAHCLTHLAILPLPKRNVVYKQDATHEHQYGNEPHDDTAPLILPALTRLSCMLTSSNPARSFYRWIKTPNLQHLTLSVGITTTEDVQVRFAPLPNHGGIVQLIHSLGCRPESIVRLALFAAVRPRTTQSTIVDYIHLGDLSACVNLAHLETDCTPCAMKPNITFSREIRSTMLLGATPEIINLSVTTCQALTLYSIKSLPLLLGGEELAVKFPVPSPNLIILSSRLNHSNEHLFPTTMRHLTVLHVTGHCYMDSIMSIQTMHRTCYLPNLHTLIWPSLTNEASHRAYSVDSSVVSMLSYVCPNVRHLSSNFSGMLLVREWLQSLPDHNNVGFIPISFIRGKYCYKPMQDAHLTAVSLDKEDHVIALGNRLVRECSNLENNPHRTRQTLTNHHYAAVERYLDELPPMRHLYLRCNSCSMANQLNQLDKLVNNAMWWQSLTSLYITTNRHCNVVQTLIEPFRLRETCGGLMLPNLLAFGVDGPLDYDDEQEGCDALNTILDAMPSGLQFLKLSLVPSAKMMNKYRTQMRKGGIPVMLSSHIYGLSVPTVHWNDLSRRFPLLKGIILDGAISTVIVDTTKPALSDECQQEDLLCMPYLEGFVLRQSATLIHPAKTSHIQWVSNQWTERRHAILPSMPEPVASGVYGNGTTWQLNTQLPEACWYPRTMNYKLPVSGNAYCFKKHHGVGLWQINHPHTNKYFLNDERPPTYCAVDMTQVCAKVKYDEDLMHLTVNDANLNTWLLDDYIEEDSSALFILNSVPRDVLCEQ